MKRRVMALFLTLIMLMSMAPAVFAADTGFSDVAADAWYAQAVKWAVDNNITGGIGNGMFGPDNTCTRGQVVTFLWAAAGKPVMENADNPFEDVSASDWYYNAVMWAVSNNITGGTSATTFSPEAPCTRAAVVTFLYAAEGKPAIENAKNDFVDVGSGDWFYAPVVWAVANNITGGIGNGCFGPDNACTRAQIALFLCKASLAGGGDDNEGDDGDTKGENEAAYVAYVPMVEQAIEDTKENLSASAVDDHEWAQGYLADLDSDGTDELLMCYYGYFNRDFDCGEPVYSLYDYENGALVKVVERERLLTNVVDDIGYAAVVDFDGKPTVMVMDHVGYGDGGAHYYNYEFYDYPDLEKSNELQYFRNTDIKGNVEEKYYINEVEVSKDAFLEDLVRCSELSFSKQGYDFYSGDPMSLNETLKALRGPIIYKGNLYETKFVNGVKRDFPVPYAKISLWSWDEETGVEVQDTVYADENGSFEVDLTEIAGYDAEISAEGYVSRAASFSIYDKKLEVSIKLVPDTYDAEAQAFMDKYRYKYMNAYQHDNSRGILYDLNGDGQDELILRAKRSDSTSAYEVWTFVDGETKLLLRHNSERWDEWIYVSQHDSVRYLVIEEAMPGSMAASHELRFYDVTENPYKIWHTLEYWEMFGGHGEGDYSIDGSSVSATSFYSLYDKVTKAFDLFTGGDYEGWPLYEFAYQEVG